MSVKPITASIDTKGNKAAVKNTQPQTPEAYSAVSETGADVSFGSGINPVVGLMDVIEAGGYPVSFVIQDGLGFVVPRVTKGLCRGKEEKKDENGNVILDKNGNPKYDLNWQYARKEALREVITGPSAFLIPLALTSVIGKKFGTAHKVKLDYIDGFKKPFTEFAQSNLADIQSGNAPKAEFYKKVFKEVIDKSLNSELSGAEKLSKDEIEKYANEFTQKQIKIEEIRADKSLGKKVRNAKIAQEGTVEDAFMKLKKSRIGSNVDETAVKFSSSNGKTNSGSIGELLKAMNDYFTDAVKTTQKSLKDNVSAEHIAEVVKRFSNRRMGSRILTNLGIFGAVAAFYTQIPKLYNMGLKGNPALKGTAAEENREVQDSFEQSGDDKNNGKEVSFGSLAGVLEKTGEKVFNSKRAKGVSDLFELNGATISGSAMPVLLYGFCIPPRLRRAQDKYDFGEIIVRDLTSFTAILFGAKALARLFSDGFTKITGLALNKKNMQGRNVFQKIFDYLNPNNTRHCVLSGKQLTSKYTNLEDYKGRVNGFTDFIEQSGGNVKKALAQDKNVKEKVCDILKKFGGGKSYEQAASADIKAALSAADKSNDKLIQEFYKLFEKENGLLKRARTCNSTFGFVSTLLLVPALIIWLTNICEKMTQKRTEKDFDNPINRQNEAENVQTTDVVLSSNPSMAGFLNKNK